MSWIKEANKIGAYERTYRTFRIYCAKEPEMKQSIIKREDGEYCCTEFIKGWFVGIDRSGIRFEGDNISAIGFKIDMEFIARFYSKKEGAHIEWKQVTN